MSLAAARVRAKARAWVRRSRWLTRLLRRLLPGLVPAGLAATQAAAATLPEERSELLYHYYDGGGVRAQGPALLVRKSIADKVSLSAQYYVDAVSNASIDVVTTASPFKETRNAYDFGADWLVRDALVSLAVSTSREPDYTANAVGVDVAHEVFGAMTTVTLGFTRGSDEVKKAGEPAFADVARHWQYRFGLTQILTPRWLASANFEAISDAGYLGSPYRAARVFGAAVPERVPRTRSSRAVKFRSLYDYGEGPARTALRAEYRYFWDNWDIKAHTAEFGAARYVAPGWLAEASVRFYSQDKALFYSDNALAETLYVTRNRQLATFKSTSFAAKATYTFGGAAARFDTKFTGVIERKQFKFSDFTDVRTGAAYEHNATVLQLLLSATF
ncbi:MAG: DUF3570 domain-containing protein [Rubrivivax sp.]